jgi:cytochrome c-type biogenesis protein CcmH/NrfF
LRLKISILILWVKMVFLFIMGVGIILGMIIRKNMLVKVRTGQNSQLNIMQLNLLNLLIVKVKFMGTLLIMRVLIIDMN